MLQLDDYVSEKIVTYLGTYCFILFQVHPRFLRLRERILNNVLKVKNGFYTKYYLFGKLHRIDGPAVKSVFGPREWWYLGERHRTDGPAIDNIHTREWWIHGRRHRNDGPAVVNFLNKKKEWWVNGKRHRFPGPAVVYTERDYTIEWWVYGQVLITAEILLYFMGSIICICLNFIMFYM